MRKFIRSAGFILMTVFMLLSLSSCAVFRFFSDLAEIRERRPEGPSYVNVGTEQQKNAEAILQALDDNDSETLKNMFCKYALGLPDLDEQIQAAMDFYEGKFVSYDEDRSIVRSDGQAIDYGIITEIHTSGEVCDILTDAGKHYSIYFYNYLVYADAPKSVGLSAIIITSLDTEEKCEIDSYDYVHEKIVAHLHDGGY